MTEFTGDGLRVNPQDLSAIDPKGGDDNRMFHHDGSSTLSIVGGGSDSERGYYIWDASANAWYPLFRNADKIDGKEAGDFLWRDGSLAMEANLDAGNYGIINVGEVSGGTGGVHLNDNHVTVHSHTAGANIRLSDNDDLLIAEAIEGGNFNTPNGNLLEQGNRVATRTWTNNNADVPNADYADNANQLGGYDEAAFLHVSGDQMEGDLDVGGFSVNDGGTTKYDGTAGEFVQAALGGPASSLSTYPLPAGDLAEDYAVTSRFPIPNDDIANPSVSVNAGNQLTGGGSVSLGGSITVNVDESGLDADLLDGNHASDFADSGHSHSQLHDKYTDSEAISAVNSETLLSVDISGDADTLDGEHASAFADSGHTHDSRYYTESEADSNFAASGHLHDERYIQDTGTVSSTLAAESGILVTRGSSGLTANNSIEGAGTDDYLGIDTTSGATGGVLIGYYNAPEVRLGNGGIDIDARGTLMESGNRVATRTWTGSNYVSQDANVESLGTVGSQGSVPTAQGDGTLAMEEVGVDDSGNVLGGDAQNTGATAIHPSTTATVDRAIAIGKASEAQDYNTVAMGWGAIASGMNSVSIGRETSAPQGSIAIGSETTSNLNSVTIGRNSASSGSAEVAIGDGASTSGHSSVAIGRNTSASNGEIVIGNASNHSGFKAVLYNGSNGGGKEYEIQVDGSDGDGIINFKTS